jgi:hypothetical protein
MKKILTSITTGFAGLVLSAVMPLAARAAGTQVVVTPSDTQGWTTSDTRPGGTVGYSMDTTAQGNPHNGALQLTTDTTSSSKAQYMHDTQTALSQVNELSYYTKQITSSFPQGDPSYQVATCLNGLTGCASASANDNFTTLVFEPYYNTDQGAVTPGTWQQWDVDNGVFWSSKTVTCSGGTITGTPGGPASYTLAQINQICPNAIVVGFGINVGSGNPGYNVEADLVNFNGTTYNFEPFKSATNKDQCKDNGWMTLTDNNGNSFKNQGQCVSYTNGRGQ